MKKEYFRYHLMILLIGFLFAGCTSMNKITYVNNTQLGEWDTSPIPPKHHLEIGDNLMVKVMSRNQEIDNIFNINNNPTSNTATTEANLYINGYTVSQKGTINLPNVGEVFILNQTIEQAKEKITNAAKEQLIDPIVIVKLVNFGFTVMGEVNRPGCYPVYKEDITILEALATAGDITDYGNLKKVKLIRSHKNKKQVYHIDLSDSKILSSEYYYLHNDDLIYVQPLPFKGFRKSQSQLLLSTLTTIAVILNVYIKFSE